MYLTVPYKTKQFFIVVIKCSIIVGACYFIYNRLLNNDLLDFSEFVSFLSKNKTFSVKNVVFLFILTSFNWFFEIAKWKVLASVTKKISFKEAIEQSLGGHTASLITPNRIGDYGAKVFYFNKEKRKQIVLLNLIGNTVQMAVTLIFGCIGLFFFTILFNQTLMYLKS